MEQTGLVAGGAAALSQIVTRFSVKRWYALQVRCRHEFATSSHLAEKGYQTFTSSYRRCRRTAARNAEADVLLFPGYIFCRFDPHDRSVPVVTTPGVFKMLGSGSRPEPVPDHVIQSLENVIRSGLSVERCTYPQKGAAVQVSDGVLAGITGTLLEVKKKAARGDCSRAAS